MVSDPAAKASDSSNRPLVSLQMELTGRVDTGMGSLMAGNPKTVFW